MARSLGALPALLLAGCYLAHGVDAAPSVDAGPARSDAGPPVLALPDAGPPPELVCEDDFDHAAEAARMVDAVARVGLGAGAEARGVGRIVEVTDESMVLEREDDGTAVTFFAPGLVLAEQLEVGEPVEWGTTDDGWHFVRGWGRDTHVWVRAFDDDAPPEPFWQRATEMRFEPACDEVDRCGDEVHQYALVVDRGWALHVAHAGERLDIETGTYVFLVAHVGSTDAALACGDPTPRFRGVVTVISREPCIC